MYTTGENGNVSIHKMRLVTEYIAAGCISYKPDMRRILDERHERMPKPISLEMARSISEKSISLKKKRLRKKLPSTAHFKMRFI